MFLTPLALFFRALMRGLRQLVLACAGEAVALGRTRGLNQGLARGLTLGLTLGPPQGRALTLALALSLALGTVLGLVGARPAAAHPHEWIDMRIALVFEDRQLVAIEQAWRFDPFFSSYVVEELNEDRPDKQVLQEQATALGPEMIGNLSKHGFLTELSYDGARIEGAEGIFTSADVIRDQMELRFRLNLRAPLDLKAADFQYRVYDPTYYIEMLHADRHRPKLKGAPWGCRVTVETPDPDEDVLLYAGSVDVDQSSDTGLGIHFAETVRLSC